MSGDRLSGQEPDVDFLMQMGFSTLEIARVQAIKGRRCRGQGRRSDLQFVLPRRFSKYNNLQRRCYADVFGDAAAQVIWGTGPWMKTFRYAQARAAQNAS